MATTTAKQEVDKKFLYGKFQKGEDDRARFLQRVAHKAADMALEDDVQISNTKTGIGSAGLVGTAAIAGATILGYALLNRPEAPQPTAPVQSASPADSEYEVRFFDKDGNPIVVPRRPQ